MPNAVKVGEAVYYGQPMTEYAPESEAYMAYRELAGELPEREIGTNRINVRP